MNQNLHNIKISANLTGTLFYIKTMRGSSYIYLYTYKTIVKNLLIFYFFLSNVYFSLKRIRQDKFFNHAQ